MFDYLSERTSNELKLAFLLAIIFSASMFLINVQIGLGHLLLISYIVIFYLLKERRKLVRQVDSLQQENRMDNSLDVDELVSLIRHEVRSPLSAIVGYAGMVEEMTKKRDQWHTDIGKYLSRIESSAERIDLIIKKLVTTPNEEKCLLEVVDLKRVATETLDFFSEKCRSNNIQFTIDHQTSLTMIKGCEVHLAQVLINLLNNSFDAVKSRTGERWVKLGIMDSCSSEVLITITDSGEGIPAAVQDKIMETFYTTKEKQGGMGIGLSISKQIIEQHNGTLKLNKLAKNTEFEILLPRW